MSANRIAKKTKPVLKEFGVKKAAIFGSLARGGFKKDSDIDILLKLRKDLTLLDVLKLKVRLEEKLGRKVDLVEYDAIKPGLRRSILKNQIPLL